MKPQGTVGYLIKDHRVLLALIKYSDHLLWNGIGGFIERGENPTQAVVREFSEETGLQLVESSLEIATTVHLPNLDLHIILANRAFGQPKPSEPSIIELRWFRVGEIPYNQMHPGNQSWLEPLLAKALTS